MAWYLIKHRDNFGFYYKTVSFYGAEDACRGLLHCDTMQWCGRIPTFQRASIPSPKQLYLQGKCPRYPQTSLLPLSLSWRQQCPPNRWQPPTSLYSVRTQRTTIWILVCLFSVAHQMPFSFLWAQYKPYFKPRLNSNCIRFQTYRLVRDITQIPLDFTIFIPMFSTWPGMTETSTQQRRTKWATPAWRMSSVQCSSHRPRVARRAAAVAPLATTTFGPTASVSGTSVNKNSAWRRWVSTGSRSCPVMVVSIFYQQMLF